MKKVAIITIYDNCNFGNRLQNYALQEVIKKYGFYVETIVNRPKDNDKNIGRKIKLFVRRIYFGDFSSKTRRRKEFFEYFSELFINSSENILYTNKKNYEDFNGYDYYIIGSDQIWNYNFRTNTFGEFEFGLFSCKEKCFSYAASFGIAAIPAEKRDVYMNGLKNLFKISVREEAGKDIVFSLIGKDAKVHIDPTMLLDASEWSKIMKKPKKMLADHYILLYFLGGVSKTRMKSIQEYANENHLKIISILDRNSIYFESGPLEFIYLINSASLIFTDSFHACVFSVLFDKPFLIFDRDGSKNEMNSRINTLLDKFEIVGRRYKGTFPKKILQSNYKRAQEILEYEKKNASDYLKSCLNNSDS